MRPIPGMVVLVDAAVELGVHEETARARAAATGFLIPPGKGPYGQPGVAAVRHGGRWICSRAQLDAFHLWLTGTAHPERFRRPPTATAS